MFVVHVALQGCLKAENVQYGVTADTGGHIRYLLELAEASARDSCMSRIVLATRLFESHFGQEYSRPVSILGEKVEIVRLPTGTVGYVAKEDMWKEVASFAERLCRWIEEQSCRPDMLHAHYADAGTVAAIVEDRLGIPFVFTAHSLGRVKAALGGMDTAKAREDLACRISAEENALSRAALVIASSRDEAEVQYAGYESYEPGRIRILPPGSDLAAFESASQSPDVEASLNRFLNEPNKPVVLALARPVRKKNLAALVRAYGENPALQKAANLVLIAGTRGDLAELDPEMEGTVREILCLIDHYDLYGRVAYPKSHRPEDVPAIYAYARARRGVFVNPALNEPFGLTLLEASAAGLPLVATDSGGPNDIIEMCHNGELVDPRSPSAIAAAALRIVADADVWDRYSNAGRVAVRSYDWPRHATRYHELLADLVAPRPTALAAARGKPPLPAHDQLLVCDIDNTLTGCSDCIRSFAVWRRAQTGLLFGVATGRSFHSAMSILEQQEAPRPQVMITSVGSEIYHLDDNQTTFHVDADWRTIVSQRWDRAAVAAVLSDLPSIVPQAPLEQRTHKLSYFSEGDPHVIERVRARLEFVGLNASIIHSHAKYLDVLPMRASKGSAVDFVRKHYGLSQSDVYVAGDSGNDIEMLRTVPQAIIVANFSDGLATLPTLSHSYVARQKYALGIIEGVDHFRKLAEGPCRPSAC